MLGAVHRLTGADAAALVLFSVVTLCVLFALPPLVLLRRPEAWLAALLFAGVVDPVLVWRLVRLFVVHPAEDPPPIAGLEWHRMMRGLWSGRLPR